MLAHAAFFEALSSISDEASPEWKATTAGLVVLRLVDTWLDLGTHVVTTDVTGLCAVRNAVTAIPKGDPIRSILIGIVDTLEQAETASIREVSSRLFAYGRALYYAGQWRLAHDVFSSIYTRADSNGDKKLKVEVGLEKALNLRKCGSLKAAEEAYLETIRDAKAVGDVIIQARAQLGRILIVEERGDLPQASTMLEALLASTDPRRMPDIHGQVLHEMAHVAYLRGTYAASVRFAYHALEFVTEAVARDRILGQLAASFALLGHLSASRDANLILVATAQEKEMRWYAMTNLLYAAVMEGHQLAFEDYRQLLAAEQLPPRVEVAYRVDSARGFVKFGQHALAEPELIRARDIAERHNLNQQLFEIDAILEGRDPLAPAQPADTSALWSGDIDSIASAIGELRHLQEMAAKGTEGVTP